MRQTYGHWGMTVVGYKFKMTFDSLDLDEIEK